LCLSNPVPHEFSLRELTVLEELAAPVGELLGMRQRLLARQRQAMQQLAATALPLVEHLLDHLAKYNHARLPTSTTAVLNA